jgi:hypothetical protein
MNTVAKVARSFFAFWWDFIIGEDVTLAAGVALGLALVAVVHATAAPAWWALPVVWIAALIWSVNRASRDKRAGTPGTWLGAEDDTAETLGDGRGTPQALIGDERSGGPRGSRYA